MRLCALSKPRPCAYALIELLIVDLALLVEVEQVEDGVYLLLGHGLEAEEADGLAGERSN